MKTITLRVEADTLEALDAEADEHERTRSEHATRPSDCARKLMNYATNATRPRRTPTISDASSKRRTLVPTTSTNSPSTCARREGFASKKPSGSGVAARRRSCQCANQHKAVPSTSAFSRYSRRYLFEEQRQNNRDTHW